MTCLVKSRSILIQLKGTNDMAPKALDAFQADFVQNSGHIFPHTTKKATKNGTSFIEVEFLRGLFLAVKLKAV